MLYARAMSAFTEGELVEYVGKSYSILEGDARFGTLQKEDVAGGFPWLLVLTPESQDALRKRDDNTVPRGELDRLAGWLVDENEIRKVDS